MLIKYNTMLLNEIIVFRETRKTLFPKSLMGCGPNLETCILFKAKVRDFKIPSDLREKSMPHIIS